MDDELKGLTDAEEILQHWGIKGMKWNKKKTPEEEEKTRRSISMIDSDIVERRRLESGPLYNRRTKGTPEARRQEAVKGIDYDIVENRRLLAGPLYQRRTQGSPEARRQESVKGIDYDIVENRRLNVTKNSRKKYNSIVAQLGRKVKAAADKARNIVMSTKKARAVNRRKGIE